MSALKMYLQKFISLRTHVKSTHLALLAGVVFASGLFAWDQITSSHSSVALQNVTSRLPASKRQTLHPLSAREILRKQGKGTGPVTIEISRVEQNEVRVGSVVTLIAHVEARGEMNDLEYVWLLPDGVSLAGGSIEGRLGTVTPQQGETLQISVVQNADFNQQIHLHVFHRVHGEVVGQIAQYNTLMQERIDANIRSKAEMLDAQSDRHSDGQRAPASDTNFKLVQ